MRFQCKYIAPPRDQYFTDIFNSSQNNAFVVIINKSNIKLVIKYGTFSLVFLALFLLKYQLIKIRWYFKRNKDRNTRENMPYLITRLIFAIYYPALFIKNFDMLMLVLECCNSAIKMGKKKINKNKRKKKLSW